MRALNDDLPSRVSSVKGFTVLRSELKLSCSALFLRGRADNAL